MAQWDTANLSGLSISELKEVYVGSIRASEITDHVGRANRIANYQHAIISEFRGRGAERAVLEELATHSDIEVRSAATSRLAWLDRAPAPPAPKPRPLRAELVWQSDHPQPPALTRAEIAARLRQNVSKHSNALVKLIRPAIGLWPQRRIDIAATTSRFGGWPMAPNGWSWTIGEAEEPRVFVGQVNCAELRGLPGAELLPSSGLISFFGDYDAVVGAFPFDSDCVFYWSDVERLVPAEAATEPIATFPTCALVPRPLLDLPHPDSGVVSDLGLNKQQRDSYFDVWLEVRHHGVPLECVRYSSFAKLLGWPAFVQHDLQAFDRGGDARLLLEVDGYCNGEQTHDWGPGGSLFYVAHELDLRAHNFANCELEGQFT
jgi:uncharacterized protein YwqG